MNSIMNRYTLNIILIILCSFHTIKAEGFKRNDSTLNISYSAVINTIVPLSNSENPAILGITPLPSLLNISTIYQYNKGNFKPTLEGNNINSFELNSEGYRQLKNTSVFGSFSYKKGFENGVNFTNTFYSNKGTPYLFVDTIGNDFYNKEEFKFTGIVSHSLNSKLFLGGKANYSSGMGGQNRDPRAENKISNSGIQIGLFYKITPDVKVGCNLFYNYFNEDIDISVIEENTTYFIFALSGLGTYSKHESSSFYRLYKRSTVGGSFQLELKQHAFIGDYSHFYDDVYDGRKESGASWSAIKHDSKLRNENFSAKYIFTLSRDLFHHQLITGFSQSKSIGTEILQNITLIDEDYSVYQWQTLSEEDKYSLKTQDLSIKYELSEFKSDLLRNYSLSIQGEYNTYTEKYYTPDMSIDYSGAKIEMEGYKHFSLNTINLSCMLSGAYVKSIDNEYDLNHKTFITELLILPDYNYYTSDYWQARTKITLDYTLKQNTSLYLQLSGNCKNAIRNTYKRYISFGLTLGVLI